MSELKRGRGLLANRQREKEEHLQGAFDDQPMPKKKKDEDFKAIRVSGEAYEIFRELKYDNRLENMADAVNIVLEVYLEHNKKDK